MFIAKILILFALFLIIFYFNFRVLNNLKYNIN